MPRKKILLSRNQRKAVLTIAKGVVGRRLEKKFVETSGILSVSTAPLIVPLTSIAQGTTDTTRIGDIVHVRNLDVRYSLIGADNTNFTRLIIFQWKEDDAVGLPQAGDVLQDTVTRPWLSPIYHDLPSRMNVMYDKTFTTGAGSTDALIRSVVLRKRFRKKLDFEGAGLTGVNKFWMLHVSDSAAGSNPSLEYYVRINFTG